jgi:hypothetical protein
MCELITELPLSFDKTLPPSDLYFTPYTYSTQCPLLLQDIQNFTETKNIIFEIYYKRNYDLLLFEKDADKYWLVSDILLFIKMKKSAASYYTLLYRKYNKWMSEQKSIYTLFNIFWRLLSPNERNLFIQIRSKKK